MLDLMLDISICATPGLCSVTVAPVVKSIVDTLDTVVVPSLTVPIEEPDEPDEPLDPEVPDEPLEPEDPEDPAVPDDPEEPDDPELPEAPEEPEEPEEPPAALIFTNAVPVGDCETVTAPVKFIVLVDGTLTEPFC